MEERPVQIEKDPQPRPAEMPVGGFLRLRRYAMRHVVAVLVAFWFVFGAWSAQAGSWNGWVYQNPYPTANILLAVKFVTPQKGWIAGKSGTILYTKDGGESWEAQESGVAEDIKSFAFVNEKQGWAVGNGGVIIHTDDGGNTWSAQISATTASLNKVFFIDEKEGWIVGATNIGVVLHTKDGGKNWEKQDLGIYRSIASIYFLDRETGWILAGDEIYRTTDGGKTWEKTSSIGLEIKRPTRDESGSPVIVIGEDRVGYDWWEGDIYFTDKNKGWVVFGYWYVSHTEDGGKSWQTEEIKHSQGHIAFTDDKHGCMAGSSILCTEDGGKTWAEGLGFKSSDLSRLSLWGISFVNQSIGWAVGKEGHIEGSGKIFKTEDGGKTWKINGGYRPFTYFHDSQIGWGLKSYDKPARSSIVRTNDGGNTWEVQKTFDADIDINRFFFKDSASGWAVGRQMRHIPKSGNKPFNYFILHTNDGGKTWITQYDEPSERNDDPGDGLFDIHFINADTGWVVGSKGRILHTKDGGKHWERQNGGTDSILRRVHFTDGKRGWVIGNKDSEREYKAIILYTDNGGRDWKIQWKKKAEWMWLTELQFIDGKIGWVAGEINEFSGDYLLVNTIDGGKTWSERVFKGVDPSQMLFLDKNRGVTLNKNDYMFVTMDGGKTWEGKTLPIRKAPWHISELFK